MFAMFDDVYWVVDGNIVYGGPVNRLTPYFKEQGYPCPRFTNPSDFVMSLLVKDEDESEEEHRRKIEQFTDYNKEHPNVIPIEDYEMEGLDKSVLSQPVQDKIEQKMKEKKPFFYMQYLILLSRTWIQYIREPAITWKKLLQHVYFSVFVGLLFLQLDNNQRGIPNSQPFLSNLPFGTIKRVFLHRMKILNVVNYVL